MKLVGEQEKTEVISVNSYFGTLILGTLPIIGDYELYKWSKSAEVRVSKQNLCKAYLKLKLVLLYPILLIIIALIILLLH